MTTRTRGRKPARDDLIGPLLSQMACEYPAGECYIRAARYLADASVEVAQAAQDVGVELMRKHGSPWDVRWPALPCWEQYAGDALWRLGRDRLQRLSCEASRVP
jgi:hypothetical protein